MSIKKIESVKDIIKKVECDGDVREGNDWCTEPYEYLEGDDLGFYQQACKYLLNIDYTNVTRIYKEAD